MDVSTIILLLAIGSYVFGLLLLFFQSGKKDAPRIPFWVIAKFLQGTGSLFLYFEGSTSPFITMVFAHGVLLLGCAYEAWAILYIVGQSVSRRTHASVTLAVIFISVITVAINPLLRAGIIFFIHGIFYGIPAWYLLSRIGNKSILRSFLGICFLLLSALYSIHSLEIFIGMKEFHIFSDRVFYQILPIATFCILLISGFSMLLLAIEKSRMELHMVEASLQKSEAQYRLFVESANEGILSFDSQRRITFVNRQMASMLGYSSDEMLGRSFPSFMPEDQLPEEEEQKKLRIKGMDSVYERCFLKKDGTRHWTLVSAKALLNADNSFAGSFGFFTDINERKLFEAEIQQKNIELASLNASKDKFFSIIAHDLKSPFQGLIGFSEILTTEYETLSDEEKLTFLNGINELSSSAYKLLENLLEWARLQTGRMDLVKENLELYGELNPTLTMLMHTAQNKNITLTYEMESLPRVNADKNMLAATVRNLISNSIKFTKPGGTISLCAKEEGEFVQITISDTGIGIGEDKLPKLFEIDQNVSTKGTAGEEGTGLGLLICKEMVEKQGGRIWVESRQGEGTKFHFTLPKA